MSASPLTIARATAVGLFLLLALVSTFRTYGDTWSFLGAQRDAYVEVTAENPNLVPEFQTLLPSAEVEFFFTHLRRDDRFYVHVEEGPFIAGVDYPTAVRTFARFQLLPAVAVTAPEQADVVLAVGADPRTLGLAYASVARSADGRYAVARVRR